MALQLIVKNTFVCTWGEQEEAAALARKSGRRHRTLHASTFSELRDDEDDEDSCGGAMIKTLSEASTAAPESGSPSSCCSSPRHFGDEEDDAAPLALADLDGDRVRELVVHADGAEVLAQGVSRARPTELRAVIAGLRGSVCEVARSAHGGKVLEQLLHHAGTRDTAFIAEELLREAATVSQNANSCDLLQRLVEYSSQDAATAALMDAVLASADATTLIGHKYSHHLVEALLSNGLPHQRRHLLEAVHSDVHRFARHRFASAVVERALRQASEAEVERLSLAILGKAGFVAALACHQSGVHIVRAMLEGPCAPQVQDCLWKAGHKLRKDRYGSQLLRELAPEHCEQVGTA